MTKYGGFLFSFYLAANQIYNQPDLTSSAIFISRFHREASFLILTHRQGCYDPKNKSIVYNQGCYFRYNLLMAVISSL